MVILKIIALVLYSYLIGSVAFGLIIVKLTTGKDIRKVESGRTGGTNAMRAAGFWAGLATAVLDLLKATSAVWVAKLLFPAGEAPINVWLHVLAPLLSILGHNYSIFSIKRDEMGRLKLGGGAGGAPCVGGSVGLWFPSILIILPLGALILFGIGYASLATLSVGLLSALVFAFMAVWAGFPWQYALYGLAAEALLIWALRPNIRRLMNGTERLIGWRAKRKSARANDELVNRNE